MSKNTDEMPIMEHMEELRRVLIVSIIATIVLAVVSYCFIDQILAILMEPLTKLDQKVNFLGVTEPIFVKLKLSFFAGFLAAMPIILWQIWSFVVPALRKNEKVAFTLFVLISYLSFMGGVAFGFFGVFRYGVYFLLQFAGPNLAPMLTIDKYISFTISFLIPFGIVFEFPLISYFLPGWVLSATLFCQEPALRDPRVSSYSSCDHPYSRHHNLFDSERSHVPAFEFSVFVVPLLNAG
jgi:sec-independent protein translocase protein TatC